MLNQIVKTVSGVVVVVALLSVYGYMAKDLAKPDSESWFYRNLHSFVSFPNTVLDVFTSKEIKNIPPTFEAEIIADTFNNLRQDVYGLNSYYNLETGDWEIRLFNFKDSTVEHRWYLKEENFNKTDREWANSEPRNPILLPNRELIASNDESQNLYRLDAESNIVWHYQNFKFHHALNLNADGNIWGCTTEPRRVILQQESNPVAYEDEFITLMDVETGQPLYNKSVSEIFFENNHRYMVYGFANTTHNDIHRDPLHLNDIEPVLADGKYWRKNDLFLSFRHRALVMQYRPSTNKIIRFIQGEFLKQHDVDILNDSTISVFNNDGTNVGTTLIPIWEVESKPILDTFDYSNIVQYHFEDSSFSYHFKDHFDQHKIYTEYQGFHQYLNNGLVYIEDYQNGVMYFMNNEEVIYKAQGPNRLDNLIENPHWVRIYENIDF